MIMEKTTMNEDVFSYWNMGDVPAIAMLVFGKTKEFHW